MELDDLILVREIARTGSLTAAARRLAISQPTASRRLQRVEEELGVQLFHRTGAMEATLAGELVLDYAAATIHGYETLREHLRQSRSLIGTLAVAASTTPLAGLVTEWMADFVATHPGVRPLISEMPSRAVEQAVAEGQAQVGFMGVPPIRRGLAAMVVADDEIVLLVPRHGQWAQAPDPVDPATLERFPVVSREDGSGTMDTVRRVLAGRGWPTRFHSVLQVASATALVRAVEAGIGAGFVSRRFADPKSVKHARIASLKDLAITRQLYLVHRPDLVAAAPVLSAFLAFSRSRAALGGVPAANPDTD